MASWTTQRGRRFARAIGSASCPIRSFTVESQGSLLRQPAGKDRHRRRGNRIARGHIHGCRFARLPEKSRRRLRKFFFGKKSSQIRRQPGHGAAGGGGEGG